MHAALHETSLSSQPARHFVMADSEVWAGLRLEVAVASVASVADWAAAKAAKRPTRTVEKRMVLFVVVVVGSGDGGQLGWTVKVNGFQHEKALRY